MKKIVPKEAILIPDTAKKVFTGQIFDVYQWPQTMFDGTTRTFEMLKRHDTVKIMAVKDGKLVMLREEQPGLAQRLLTFAGGRVEPGDVDASLLDAAKRELIEETGLVFGTWKLVHVKQISPQHIEGFFHWFIASDLIEERPATPDAAGEKIKVELIDYQEVKRKAEYDTELYFAWEILREADSCEELLALPEFDGQEVDR